MIIHLLDASRIDREQKNKVIHKIRTSQGTKISKNSTSKQVLRLNILKSRKEGYPIQEIAQAYQISKRTVHTLIKNNLFQGKHRGVTKKYFRSMVKLITRSIYTNIWIKHILRHNITDLSLIIDSIENKVKPP